MWRTVGFIFLGIFLLILFVSPVREALNNLSRREEVREEQLIGTVATFNPEVKAIQKTLHEAGFEPGLIDGAMGEKTRRAISLFQESNGLRPGGWIDQRTLDKLEEVRELIISSRESGSIEQVPREAPAVTVEKTAENIQKALKKEGFYRGAIDGKIGNKTIESIKAFQRARSLKQDGVVGNRTWEELRKN